ncbi:MAG: cobaltochelatase subunit CobN [Candidatus Competibacterales bacterium]
MHLLDAQPGGGDDTSPVRIEQTPGDIVVLSAADTDIGLLAKVAAELPAGYPSLRLLNLQQLRQHASVDLYVDAVVRHAQVVVVAVLGGVGYWPYGVERLTALAEEQHLQLILFPGDDAIDPDLMGRSTLPFPQVHALWRLLREGGRANARGLLEALGRLCRGDPAPPTQASPLPRVAWYRPGEEEVVALGDDPPDLALPPGSVALVVFYRAHLQAGNTQAFDALAAALATQGLVPLLLAVASLKEPAVRRAVEAVGRSAGAAVVLNTTGFALANPKAPQERPLALDCPVLQVIMAGSTAEAWAERTTGLTPRDLAMNVALPEVDGRIITRAVSFKALLSRQPKGQADVVGYAPVPDRLDFVAQLARHWVALGATPAAKRRIALVLANYPARNGRVGNGVGLDTPASTVVLLQALAAAGYPVADTPGDGAALMAALLRDVTPDGDGRDLKACGQSLSLVEYKQWFATLPPANRDAVLARWGEVEDDPLVRGDRLMVPGLRFGLTFVGIQPARGYEVDPSACYHDPDLVPPHGYLGFYCWLRHGFAANAVIHVGKHGNLEWLPGKGVALAPTCWPEVALGPMPHLYPFIVNDPGEGTQAKRRAQAVIIDHLMPPLTRAESYGPLAALERDLDEYAQARSLDPPRAIALRHRLLQAIKDQHLAEELPWIPRVDAAADPDPDEVTLGRLDGYLCELKEAQIRAGLHILGQSPRGEQRWDTLVALARLPTGDGCAGCDGLIRALGRALGLPGDYDPLTADPADPWTGPKPAALAGLGRGVWRTAGDTRERLELFARAVIAGEVSAPPGAEAVLGRLFESIAPNLDASGPEEIRHTLAALEGRFVPPGPSGAPSRGRLDVLPTGRNFYGVDLRALPTPTAWELGRLAAENLVARHLQEHGDYPTSIGLSVWGTATMRTGGDDIAQALALLGVRPVWDPASGQVGDFAIVPLEALGRPRLDVMLRVSGFFRDAFANLIALFDAAVQAVVATAEDPADNFPRARALAEAARLEAEGLSTAAAARRARWRVFGAKPGAYGAGLQGLMDSGHWRGRSDLAAAYLQWGGYAYGGNAEGIAAHDAFRNALAQLDAVVHNQDNREHDLLDADDYYQFQGGMAAAVETFKGTAPTVYHGDHALPMAPKVRTLKEELSRVVRSRAVNPKWLAAMRRHGYKGAFEMAATVDYLFAFGATTDAVADHHYTLVADAYLLDPANRDFLQRANPHALRDMAERLLEAVQRGLWRHPEGRDAALEALLLDVDAHLEDAP